MQQLISLIIPILVDTSFSWMRMFAALFISIVVSLFVGIYAASNSSAERIIIPVLDIFQTLPILAFFPFVIFVIVAVLPGYIGINAAVIFLIVTSMVWNITFGVYEAVKTIPQELVEVGKIFNLSPLERLTKILIPASMPKVVDQSILSWSIGLFYLVTSEIFSTGNAMYSVKHGIGALLASVAFSGNFTEYVMGIAIFIIFVIATRLIFFGYLKKRFTKHMVQERRTIEEARKSDIIKALDKISPFNKVNLATMHRNVISIRNRFARPMVIWNKKTSRKAVQKKDRSNYMHLLYAAAALILIYIAFIYRGDIGTLAGYERTVLVALGASLLRIWLAFAVILAISLPVGVYLVFMSKRRSFYLMLFQIIASIPATILLPVIVVYLRNAPYHSELVAFTIFFLSGIWYMIFGIVSSRSMIPESVREVQGIFGVKGKTAWKKIYLKAILPGVITGAITGVAAEWNASIVAEWFTTNAISNSSVVTSVNVGLGKLLDVSLTTGNLTLMVLGLINLTVVIILVNRLVWKKLYNRILSPYK
ncbi:MAG: ABC transporter permease subunit [Candidatus Micrarchaeaceae archaeon]